MFDQPAHFPSTYFSKLESISIAVIAAVIMHVILLKALESPGNGLSILGAERLSGLGRLFLGRARLLPGTQQMFLGLFWLLGIPCIFGERRNSS
jgi:hypothetical protein